MKYSIKDLSLHLLLYYQYYYIPRTLILEVHLSNSWNWAHLAVLHVCATFFVVTKQNKYLSKATAAHVVCRDDGAQSLALDDVRLQTWVIARSNTWQKRWYLTPWERGRAAQRDPERWSKKPTLVEDGKQRAAVSPTAGGRVSGENKQRAF